MQNLAGKDSPKMDLKVKLMIWSLPVLFFIYYGVTVLLSVVIKAIVE